MMIHMLQNIDRDMGNTIPRPQSLWTTLLYFSGSDKNAYGRVTQKRMVRFWVTKLMTKDIFLFLMLS